MRAASARTAFTWAARDQVAGAVRGVIPDATDDEIATWIGEARLASRTIDGRRMLHARSLQNLLLFSPQARGRRDAVKPPAPATWSLAAHVKAVRAEAARTGSDHVLPVRHRVTHTLTVPVD
ncbi:MAG: hypothetical protein ACKON7_11515, partial [Planctomycetaceae bacterium]